MCEIAVFDPEQFGIEQAHQLAGIFNDQQGDGIGVVAVKPRGDRFEYDTYKSTEPHWQTLYSWFNRHYSDTWRFVLHGRNATSGNINRQTAHPIRLDCHQCDTNFVVHNGSVRNRETLKQADVNTGHHYCTDVDTEIIGHRVSELPETVEDHAYSTYPFRGNLSYLTFFDDGILIHVEHKYQLSEDFTMTCSSDRFEEPAEHGFSDDEDTEWMLVTPSPEGPEIETKDRSVAWTGSYNRGDYYNNTDNSDNNVTQHIYGKSYTELLPEYSTMTAIKVAPGVIEVIDTENDESCFVWRDEEPQLYYYYAPEDPEEDEQEQIEEDSPEAVTHAVAEEVSTAVVEAVEEVSAEDMGEMRDELIGATREGAQQAISNYAE